MKRIFIIIAAALLATGVQAQNNQYSNYIGLHIGGGLNSLLYNPDSGSFRPGFGGQAGIQYMHFFGKHFGFGIGAQYGVYTATAKYDVKLQGSTLVTHPSNNWQYYPVNVYDNMTERQMVSTLGIPVELYFRAPMGDKWAFLLGLGAQFDMPIANGYKVVAGQYETQGYFPVTNVTYRDLPDYGFHVYNDRPHGSKAEVGDWGVSLIADLGFNVALSDHWGLYMGIYGGYGLTNLYDTVNAGNALLTIDPNDVTKIDYNSTIASSRIDAFNLISAGIKLGINFGWNCHSSKGNKGNDDNALVSRDDNDNNKPGKTGDNGDNNNNNGNNDGQNPANYGNDGADDAEAAAAAEERCNARRMNDPAMQDALNAIDADLAEAEQAANESGSQEAKAKVADARAKAADAKKAIKNGKYCKAYDLLAGAYGDIADSYADDAAANAAKCKSAECQKAAEDAALYADAAHKCELDCAMASSRNAKINSNIAKGEGYNNGPDYKDPNLAEQLSKQALNMANEVGSKPGVTNAKDASGKAYRGNLPDSYAASAKSFANSASTCASKSKNAEAQAAAAEAQRYANEAAEAARMGNTAAAYRAAVNAREAAYRACNMANSEDTDDKPATSRDDAKKQLAGIGATVNFDFNETDPLFDSKTDKAINTICSAMAADKSIKIVITGHTDNIGSDESNMALGKRRAQMLKDLMVKRGAPAANISIASKGESEPIVPNDTDEHRYQNRRAVITIK
ncbi:MAG: OmpA family protein [Bacteroidales bacterium]|nr:OmpA family protein [Bacteroidales bacterium]